MEDLRIWGINLSAVGISFMNINSVLTTLVLLASLCYTVLKIKDRIKINFSKLKNPLFFFRRKFSLKNKIIKTNSEIPNINGFKPLILATSENSKDNCVLEDVAVNTKVSNIEKMPKYNKLRLNKNLF